MVATAREFSEEFAATKGFASLRRRRIRRDAFQDASAT
jgi:hypothetical protein